MAIITGKDTPGKELKFIVNGPEKLTHTGLF
jgi:hypothetical protein